MTTLKDPEMGIVEAATQAQGAPQASIFALTTPLWNQVFSLALLATAALLFKTDRDWPSTMMSRS
jgi:hypothetical protein